MTTSPRLFYHFFKRRIVNYILQPNFEETVIVLEEQCFLVTLSFNTSTLIKKAFLKKTATNNLLPLFRAYCRLHYIT